MDNEDIRVVPGEESSASDTVREFRNSLDTRRDAEDVMAAALQARQQTAAYADEIIRHSEALAAEIEEEARASARISKAEAKGRADQILTEAVAKAEQLDEHTSTTIRRLEAAAGEVLSALDRARADLVDAMVPLAALRALGDGEPLPVDEAVGDDRPHERRRNPFRAVH